MSRSNSNATGKRTIDSESYPSQSSKKAKSVVYDVKDLVVVNPSEDMIAHEGKGDIFISTDLKDENKSIDCNELTTTSVKYQILYQLKKSPPLLSSALQDIDTGLFVLRSRMTLEFFFKNDFKAPIRLMLLYVDRDGGVMSVFPKISTKITCKNDLYLLAPQAHVRAVINESQLSNLKNESKFEFILIAAKEEEDNLEELVQRIQSVEYPLDTENRYVICCSNVLMMNYVFEKM
jgi:hypothetical protein